MTDLISRADAIEAIDDAIDADSPQWAILRTKIGFLPSAETHEIRTETHGVCLISKDDAMGAVQDHFNANGFKGYDDGQKMMDRIKALPSAEAEPKENHTQATGAKHVIKSLDTDSIAHEEEHLNIVNRIKELQYAIAKTQTIVGEMVESAEAVQGEWIRLIEYVPESNESLINFDGYQCSVCGGKLWADSFNFWNYCPNCGARMYREDGE